jgi:hypothetical protein
VPPRFTQQLLRANRSRGEIVVSQRALLGDHVHSVQKGPSVVSCNGQSQLFTPRSLSIDNSTQLVAHGLLARHQSGPPPSPYDQLLVLARASLNNSMQVLEFSKPSDNVLLRAKRHQQETKQMKEVEYSMPISWRYQHFPSRQQHLHCLQPAHSTHHLSNYRHEMLRLRMARNLAVAGSPNRKNRKLEATQFCCCTGRDPRLKRCIF